MTTKVTKYPTLVVELETKPGSLAAIYRAFRESSLNMRASWGYEMGPGKAQVILCPQDLTKTKDVLTKMGRKFTTSNVCYAEGEDRVGCYSELLDKVTKANINLHATDAVATAGKFTCGFWTEDKDFPALCKALGC